jgi:FkbM family methyltransferase
LGPATYVGAHHGYALERFAERGWTIHAFEPDPANRAVLNQRHPDIEVDSRAVTERDGDQVDFYTSDLSTGISTLSPFHDSHRPTSRAETVRLDTYLADKGVSEVTFLKTDIEGFDLFALHGFPWNRLHPPVVVCEFEDNKTGQLGYRVEDLCAFLRAQNYTVLVSEWHPIVEYGGPHRWRIVRRYPVDLGPDSWGNLIATAPELEKQALRIARRSGRRLMLRRVIDRTRARYALRKR